MAEATLVLAIRHGETAWNVNTRVQGQLDIALNDSGRWQAKRLARALAEQDLAAVYSSDLVRARDTARAFADTAATRGALLEAGLRERGFGIFEGHTFAQVEQRWPAQALRWRQRDPDFAPAGGETLRRFYARAVATATRLAARHPGRTIALVTHGGVLDCLYRAAARVELQAPRTWQLANTAINRLLYSDTGFTLVGWNDLTHLDEPASAQRRFAAVARGERVDAQARQLAERRDDA